MICHMRCEGGQCTISESGNIQTENIHKCNFCEETFTSKKALSTHKADVHKTFKPCRDPINCVYQAGCYFSHVPVTLGKVRCYQCGEEFNTKNVMMIHRKTHGGVKDCIDLIRNSAPEVIIAGGTTHKLSRFFSRSRRTCLPQYWPNSSKKWKWRQTKWYWTCYQWWTWKWKRSRNCWMWIREEEKTI